MTPRLALAAAVLIGFSAANATETAPTVLIGTLDLFGLRHHSPAELRAALPFKEGDVFDRPRVDSALAELKERWHLARVTLAPIRTDATSGLHLYVGVQEAGASGFALNAAPTGDTRLDPALDRIYRDFIDALPHAVSAGTAREDDSQGHALNLDPALRRAEEDALAQMREHETAVKDVLRNSANAEDRQAAAWLLGYAPDKTTVTDDLLAATRDIDGTVRNNATRALGAIAVLADLKPELRIRIDPTVFIAMLDSADWTDRNKASFVLLGLTKSRPPELLARLRKESLPDLIEMTRWKSEGHAFAPALILGRVAGWEDQRIFTAISKGDRESIIAAVTAGR